GTSTNTLRFRCRQPRYYLKVRFIIPTANTQKRENHMVSIEIGLSTLAVFIPASLALVVAPGPDSIYVLTRSISGGQQAGISSALGTATGVLVHTSAAVLGLSAILRSSALVYTVVKYAGALYLLYLG